MGGHLGPREKAVLDFERAWWQYPGPKDQVVRDVLGISSTRYYQILTRLLDDPAAQAYDPLVVRRLRKQRDRRRVERLSERHPAIPRE